MPLGPLCANEFSIRNGRKIPVKIIAADGRKKDKIKYTAQIRIMQLKQMNRLVEHQHCTTRNVQARKNKIVKNSFQKKQQLMLREIIFCRRSFCQYKRVRECLPLYNHVFDAKRVTVVI